MCNEKSTVTLKVGIDGQRFKRSIARFVDDLSKWVRVARCYEYAAKAERRARRLRKRGERLAAEAWERHAANRRRVAGKIEFGGAECSP